jgi:hypothetical protein
MVNKMVMGMFTLRMISGTIEILAAIWMLRLNQIDKALMINASLAIIGPIVLLTTTTIGLIGLADKMSFSKMIWIVIGVSFMFMGILKK